MGHGGVRPGPKRKDGPRGISGRLLVDTKPRNGERFDPYSVFDRDGWVCQLCGCDTPRSHRGTLQGNAPELDHIVPLARGGVHSQANTQCACRACNGAKGATMPLGGDGGGQIHGAPTPRAVPQALYPRYGLEKSS